MLLADALSATSLLAAGNFFEQVFGGDVPIEPLALNQIAARAIVIYIVGLAIVRVGKSRIISRATSVDVILGFILGSLLSRGITGHASISGTLLASAVIVALHWLFTAVACRSHRFGMLLKGNDRLVVKDGRMLHENMLRSHISNHDLIEQMRLRGVENLAEVRAAYKERNGEVSIIPHKSPPQILEVTVEPGVQTIRIALE